MMSSTSSSVASAKDQPFDHLVFDLDDTLLDTFRQLLPRATREACKAMVRAGLAADLEEAIQACAEHGKCHARQELFTHLVKKFGTKESADPKIVAATGYKAFYNREVESDISLFPGAREMLVSLRKTYSLHLVTAGHRPTQEAKIRILGLEPVFTSISHVDPAAGERKGMAFERIMSAHGGSPNRYLSIGNRIDTDISEARRLGWRACWVRYGEYNAMKPSSDLEMPDYEIDRIDQLAEKCRL